MKKETRTKSVEYDVYIAKDGKEFKTEKECVHYEKILEGTRIVCPECEGKGFVLYESLEENYHTGVLEKMYNKCECDKCKGKGYLDKIIKEVWE